MAKGRSLEGSKEGTIDQKYGARGEVDREKVRGSPRMLPRTAGTRSTSSLHPVLCVPLPCTVREWGLLDTDRQEGRLTRRG